MLDVGRESARQRKGEPLERDAGIRRALERGARSAVEPRGDACGYIARAVGVRARHQRRLGRDVPAGEHGGVTLRERVAFAAADRARDEDEVGGGRRVHDTRIGAVDGANHRPNRSSATAGRSRQASL